MNAPYHFPDLKKLKEEYWEDEALRKLVDFIVEVTPAGKSFEVFDEDTEKTHEIQPKVIERLRWMINKYKEEQNGNS